MSLIKSICLSLAILACSGQVCLAGGNKTAKTDTSICLKVTGKIVARLHSNGLDMNTVSLYYNNTVIQTQQVADGKTFRFFMKKNGRYAIKIEKDGYVPNLMCFNTIMPAGEDVFGVCSFYFNTELIAEAEKVSYNSDALDFPAAIVSFIPKKQTFDISQKYTQQIEKEIMNQPEGTVVSQKTKTANKAQAAKL